MALPRRLRREPERSAGNFLFLAPYSHGITLGFLCGLLALLLLHRFSERGTRRTAFAAGALLGLAFLSKAEIFLGAALGAGAMCGAGRRSDRGGSRLERTARALERAGLRVDDRRGGRSIRGADRRRGAADGDRWHVIHAFDPSITGGDFYRTMRGTDDVGRSLVRVGTTTAGIAAFVAAIMAAARAIDRRASDARARRPSPSAWPRRRPSRRSPRPICAGCCSPGGLPPGSRHRPGTSALRRRQEGLDARRLLLLGLACFAAGLLPKILLVPMARQYGFVLTVPGAMLLACLLVRWIPDRVAKSGARPGTMAAAGWGSCSCSER